MADPPPSPNTGDDAGVGPDRESSVGLPRWVKVVGIVVALLILMFLAVQLIGGGHQIPQHAPSLGAAWLVTAPARYLQ